MTCVQFFVVQKLSKYFLDEKYGNVGINYQIGVKKEIILVNTYVPKVLNEFLIVFKFISNNMDIVMFPFIYCCMLFIPVHKTCYD